MRKIALLLAVIGLGLPVIVTSPAQATTSSRTWVSGTGIDSGSCTRAAPCLTFAFALGVTSPGGEINCRDAGDYGGVFITFAVTISCEAGTAAITAGGGTTALTISAATTDDITLRGLDLNGLGTADIGINILSAKTVHIENCAIRGFRFANRSAGIFTANANTIFVYVTDSVISGNTNGVNLTSSGGFKIASLKNTTITGSTSDGVLANNVGIYVNITESVISGNGGSAVRIAAPASIANIDRTTMTNNAVALNAGASGATIRAIGNNIFDNGIAFAIAGGATVATDGQNRTGGNLNGQDANASVTLK